MESVLFLSHPIFRSCSGRVLCGRWWEEVPVDVGRRTTGVGLTSPLVTSTPTRGEGSTLLRVVRGLRTKGRGVFTTGEVSLTTTGTSKLPPTIVGQLTFSRKGLTSDVDNVQRLVSLPSPMKGIALTHRLSRKLHLCHIAYPVNIVTVVFRTHPSTVVRVSSLTIGDKGYTVLGNKGRAGRAGHILFSVLRRTSASTGLPSRTLFRTRRRDRVSRLLAYHRSMSLVVPQNSGTFIRRVVDHAGVPIVKRTSNVYRVCISGSCSVTGTVPVIVSTGARCATTYGTTRALLIRQSVTGSFLPMLRGTAKRGCVHLHNAGRTKRVVPLSVVRSSSFHRRCLSLILTIGVISNIRRTVSRVGECNSRRASTVVARGVGATTQFVRLISSTNICRGTSAHFTSKFQCNFNTRINVSANGLRTENPIKLRKLLSCGCGLFNGNRVIRSCTYRGGSFRFGRLWL